MSPRRIVKSVLAHASIVLSGMLLVLLAIDRVNEAMMFIDNDITKGLLWALCTVSILNAARLLARPKKKKAARKRPGTQPHK